MKRTILLFVLVFCVCPALAQHPDDYRWDGRFGLPGVSFLGTASIRIIEIKAMASTGDYVIVGGKFTAPGENIALWNKRTSSWEKAGTGITLTNQYSSVSGILAEGNSIIVWGRGIKSAGGKRAEGWAMYNLVTKDWATDTRLYGDINSAVRYDGDIVFSGNFTIQGTPIKNIARWNGKEWKEFTSDATQLLNNSTLAVWQNRLFAIGRIDEASTTPALLYEWNGTQWKRLLDSITITPPLGISDASKLYKIAADKSLYIYGAMDSIKAVGGQALKCRNLARYDGTSWSSVLDTIGFNGSNGLQSMCVVGDDLYIGGDIALVNGIEVKGVARWNAKDRRWNALGSGIPQSSWGRNICSIVFDGVDIYAAGQFDIAGAQLVHNIARYSPVSSEWSALSGTTSFGLSDRSNVTNSNGQLVAVGSFVYAGTKQVNSLATWNGTEWSSLGSGIFGGTRILRASSYYYQPGISHYIRLGNSAYIAGMFEVVGSVNCFNICRFNEISPFECADSGVTASTIITIFDTVQIYYPSYISSVSRIGPKLYVVGDFTVAGTTPARCVASWDGATWSALGKGIDGRLLHPLYSAVDSAGGLLVAGSFTSIDGQSCNGLARWDGLTWSPVGFTTSTDAAYIINSLCVAPNNDIYVAGRFGLENGTIKNIIKRWDGVRWHTIGETLPNSSTSISVIAVKGNLLYVAGKFDSIGTVAATNVAVFNLTTGTWSPLGSGVTATRLDFEISSIAFIGDTVYFGGRFNYAGGKPSFNIAAWLPANPSSVEQLSTDTPEMLALTFSPNPASTNGTFDFHLEKNANVRLILADALGREVMTVAEGAFAAGLYRAGADVSLLPVGVYYARLYTTHGTTTCATVIAR